MENYDEQLRQRAVSFQQRKSEDLDVDIDDVFRDIDWTREDANDGYFKKLIRAKIVPSREVTRRRNEARKSGRLADELGQNPDTPMAFVKAWADKTSIKVDWKGSMWIAGEFCQLTDLKRVMRMKALELGLRYDRGDVDDASEQLYRSAMAARPAAVNAILSVRRPFDWNALAAFFKTDEMMTPDLVVAILQKFVHSARRKLAGAKVTHHLMPMLHGAQGCGKTYLIERMLSPIAEAVSWSNFEQITDDRNIALWNSLVIVLDEMARAHKADAETIKNVITSETLDRRPMRENATIPVLNRATMIGASNHRLDELIKDDTGNRRFIELLFQRPADRTLADRLDFGAMWASIQPGDPDPLEHYRDRIVEIQRQSVVLGPVQAWLEDFSTADFDTWNSDQTFSTEQMYAAFLMHRHRVTPAVDFQARSQTAFASELRRIIEQFPEYAIRKIHTRAGKRWVFDNPVDKSGADIPALDRLKRDLKVS